MSDIAAKCYIHEAANATKCSMCGREICKEYAVDYYGKTICTACCMPLIGFFCNMHADPTTLLEKEAP